MGFAQEYALMCQRCVEALAELEGEALAVRDEAFGGLALELFEFQMRWNPAYRNFVGARDIDGWKAIPAVPASAFKDLARPVSCFPIEEAEGFFETSGTTGEVKGRHYFYDFEMYRAAIEASLQPLQKFGLPGGLRRCWLPGTRGRSSLRFMLEFLSSEGQVGELDPDEPVLLMGTALSFLHLFEGGTRHLPEGSWAMETGGYKGRAGENSRSQSYTRCSRNSWASPASAS